MSQAVAQSILERPRGTVRLSARADGVDIYVREDAANFSKYPSPCPGDLRLAKWTIGGASVVCLLVSMARKPLFTFQSWINVMNSRDNQVLGALATNGSIMVHILSRDSERAIRLPNVVHRDAAAVVGALRNEAGSWTVEQFDAACRQLDMQYPTAYAMYRELAR
ncbi:MAG: hypothetical protein IT450_19290 [Phycisphaerales bacterium]|nr:hypothetical protein [Phycisphaerales bacterium]